MKFINSILYLNVLKILSYKNTIQRIRNGIKLEAVSECHLRHILLLTKVKP